MARRKAEIDLLGVASKEELVKFEVGKQDDKALSETVSQINKVSNKNLVTEEELLRIKKKGEQEILDIQNELKEFKLNEERKMSHLPIEEDDEEEEEYIPTRLENISYNLKRPFVFLVDSFDDLTLEQKFRLLRSILLVFLVCITMTLAVFAAKKYRIDTREQVRLNLETKGTSQVAMPLTDIQINGESFSLTKVSFDGMNTIFVFEGMTNFTDHFSATMVDRDGNTYQMDQHYMRNLREDTAGSTIALEPLNDGLRMFDLLIKDEYTGDIFKYNFILNEFLKKPNYINMYNTTYENKTGLNIDSFSATESGSVLNFSLASNGLDYRYNIIERPGMNIALYENLSILPSKQDDIEEYRFDKEKLNLYEETYNIPKDLTSTLNFKIDNIFKTYDSGKVISNAAAKEGTKVDFGQYSLYIDGLQKRGDMAVLVYHCIDNSFVPAEPVEENKKIKNNSSATVEPVNTFEVTELPANKTEGVYTYVDFEILLKNYKGEVVDTIKPSKINIGAEGADVIFVDDRLSKVVSNFDIRINSVNVRPSIYEASVNLKDNSKLSHTDQNDYQENLENIEKAFEQRLGYKAAQTSRDEIEFFSDAILNDKTAMEYYLPMKLESPATYSANVITSKKQGNLLYVVVEEDFIYTEDGVINHKNKSHSVTYDALRDEIISDKILKDNQIN